MKSSFIGLAAVATTALLAIRKGFAGLA